MAATTQPLVWEFYRAVEGATDLGGVVHYYDEFSQSLWPSGSGLKTSIAEVEEGHWRSSVPGEVLEIETQAFENLSFEHALNGVLFGAAVVGDDLVYMRYVYAFDCSDIISSGNMGMSNSNSIVQIKANLMNINEDVFLNESTVFQPGAKITFKILSGGDPYDMCVAYLDSVEYDKRSSTVPISGRNSIGFKLMEATFDDVTSIEGTPDEVLAEIFDLAGIKKYIVGEVADANSMEHSFKPAQSLMSGVEQVLELYSDMKLVELADGTIVVGPRSFVDTRRSNGYYVFDSGLLFKRRTKRSSDSAYTKVRVAIGSGDDEEAVIVPVKNYDQWKLPANKTYHATAPEGMASSELQTYAESLAESLKYVGVGEDFTGSLQPHLLIGDVAAEKNEDDSMTVLGIITSLKHTFGKSGFGTEFSTDSGGIVLDTRSNLVTITKPLGGYTRKQTMKDMIQASVGSSAGRGQQVVFETVKVVTSTDAATLQGKTYDQLVAEITRELGVGLDEIAALVGGDA